MRKNVDASRSGQENIDTKKYKITRNVPSHGLGAMRCKPNGTDGDARDTGAPSYGGIASPWLIPAWVTPPPKGAAARPPPIPDRCASSPPDHAATDPQPSPA